MYCLGQIGTQHHFGDALENGPETAFSVFQGRKHESAISQRTLLQLLVYADHASAEIHTVLGTRLTWAKQQEAQTGVKLNIEPAFTA